MTEITTFEQAEAALMRYMPLVKKMTGRDLTITRMTPMMNALGNPEQKLKAIHVAGTSGKTSTTYYITTLLVTTGKKIGTTVSPHIDSLAERVQINGRPLSEQEFCSSLNEFLSLIEGLETVPTYFELMIAFAYWYFVRAGVDYAVVETGLGGLHDSTNVLQRADKVCVITDIGYDHMDILGHTLPEIATQKAGIIQEKNTVIMYEQGNEIMREIKLRCQEKKAVLRVANPGEEPLADLLPVFQQRNWHLAYEVYLFLAKRDSLPAISNENLVYSLAVQVPGRMDVKIVNGKTIVMDGAHNAQKTRAFVDGVKKLFSGQKAALLVSLKSDKDFADIFPLLAEISDKLIITSFSLSQDIPVHSAELAVLERAAQSYFERVDIVEDQDEAYNKLVSLPQKLLVITGSFYLIGQLRRTHKELKNGAS